MGGKVFVNGVHQLSTPRMPPALYLTLRDKYLSILSTLYDNAAVPSEAPGKDSYGDVDIVVSGPKSTSAFTSLTTVLDAKASSSCGPVHSFAVLYPDLPDTHVQLDVHLCPPERFVWTVFHESHGDLWDILGMTIRRFGLTANDVGLHLRIAEIEESQRKKCLLLLTSEPDEVLGFLGLDREAYSREFGTVEELYRYICSTRFFREAAYVTNGLKGNDRRRMAQRELYRRFFEEWIPKLEKERKDKDVGVEEDILTRELVCTEALSVFGKQKEYAQRIDMWRKQKWQLNK